MSKVNVDMYNEEIDFESEDERVTNALIFYLRAKGVAEVITTVGWLVIITGVGFLGYKMLNSIMGILKG